MIPLWYTFRNFINSFRRGVTFDVDTSQAQAKIKTLVSKYNNQIPREALTGIADAYLKFLKRRYLSGADWEELKGSTIAKKSMTGSPTPEAILREYDSLYNGLEKRIYKRSILVGYISNRKHTTPGRRTPSRYGTNRELAELHSRGTPTLPSRKIVVPPSKYLMKEMRKIIISAINKNTKDN